MRNLTGICVLVFVLVLAIAFTGCSDAPKPAPKQVVAIKVIDDTRKFPIADLVDTKVVERELMGKAFMPGGTIAHYKKGKVEYDMFVARMADANTAAITLPDWRKALTDSKLIPSFGGYFGSDAGRPVFVFSKNAWIAGVAGLNEKEADAVARTLASRLD
jgi:hypothetical protein